jgi:hypothetical protein
MVLKNRQQIATIILYICLLIGIAWQGKSVFGLSASGGKYPAVRTFKVTISGDVRRPGLYRVPEGTTQFEILKVAGVRPTSDLSTFNLMGPVDQTGDITVGSQDRQVELRQQPLFARLEFFFGDLTITSKDGRGMPVQLGMPLNEGDNIQSEASTQAELSLGAFSRADLDNYTSLTLDKIGADDNGRPVVQLFQKNGACWYKYSSASKNEQYKVLTKPASITVSGNGADFLLDVQPDQMVVNLMDGQLLIERSGGGEAINLISGHSAKIYNDSRPIQISRLAPDLSATERFTQLSQEKKTTTAKNPTFDFLFCGTPAVFFITHLNYEKGTISVVRIPPRLFVEPFAQGVSTIDEAYLYGGPTFINSILERMLGTRLSRYCVFTKDNIIRTADILGGIPTNVDAKAASQLHIIQGSRKLASAELVHFLSPAGISTEEQVARQRQVLGSIFDGMRSKNIVLTTQTIQQVLNSVESNMTAGESMDAYVRFTTAGNWVRKDVDLPVQESREKGRIMYEPVLDKCRTLLDN